MCKCEEGRPERHHSPERGDQSDTTHLRGSGVVKGSPAKQGGWHHGTQSQTDENSGTLWNSGTQFWHGPIPERAVLWRTDHQDVR